ncbi:MAG: UDP-glucose/GDP-mannose dehydrogenase family protein [Parcubacteria group bacterium]|nr:UDP-glucose/GDP-mannose dehydrogenase family protein [Parcubacteria group bacterium]
MKILYFGGGFVGACSAAVSADSGHEVLVYDINQELVNSLSSGDKDKIESYLFEKGLGDLLIRNQARIKFTFALAEAEKFIDEAEAVFMCLPTPERDGTGETNLEIYENAARTLAGLLTKRNQGKPSRYVLIINKSTVPIDMINRTKEIMLASGVKNFGVGSNPEFLVEGKAIEGSIRPARVVVGADSQTDFAIFRNIYGRFVESSNVSYLEVSPAEAEAGKLLANYILFSRLANCFDVVGRICEKFSGLQFENIRKVLITDGRIGDWGFYDSLFAGGSCFIKDARSLAHQLKVKGAETDLIDDVLAANQRQLNNFLARAEAELNFSWAGKTVGLLGLAFKQDTNDIRNAASLGTTEFLLTKAVKQIKVYDPAAGNNYLKYFSGHKGAEKINLVGSELEVIKETDILIITADWPQFRGLDGLILENLPKGALIMDGRRMLAQKYDELMGAGYDIIAVGSPLMKAKL